FSAAASCSVCIAPQARQLVAVRLRGTAYVSTGCTLSVARTGCCRSGSVDEADAGRAAAKPAALVTPARNSLRASPAQVPHPALLQHRAGLGVCMVILPPPI